MQPARVDIWDKCTCKLLGKLHQRLMKYCRKPSNNKPLQQETVSLEVSRGFVAMNDRTCSCGPPYVAIYGHNIEYMATTLLPCPQHDVHAHNMKNMATTGQPHFDTQMCVVHDGKLSVWRFYRRAFQGRRPRFLAPARFTEQSTLPSLLPWRATISSLPCSVLYPLY